MHYLGFVNHLDANSSHLFMKRNGVMSKVIRLSGVLLILLVIAEAASNYAAMFLPLGGSQLIQMAIVFGLGFAASELISIFKEK